MLNTLDITPEKVHSFVLVKFFFFIHLRKYLKGPYKA